MAEPEIAAVERTGSKRVPIELVHPNPRNPRRSFGEEDLSNLAQSIREKGVVQPILVRPTKGATNSYEIIAGERRWRASQRAGQHDIPVIVQEVSDKEALELAIIENVQRADLNPIEEAFGYEQLIAEFGYTQQDLGQIIGKSRSHVANTLRLLKLPETVKVPAARGQAHCRPCSRPGGCRGPVRARPEDRRRGHDGARRRKPWRRRRSRSTGRRSAGRKRTRTPTRWRWRRRCPICSASAC